MLLVSRNGLDEVFGVLAFVVFVTFFLVIVDESSFFGEDAVRLRGLRGTDDATE
jgi:hypothetical protein